MKIKPSPFYARFVGIFLVLALIPTTSVHALRPPQSLPIKAALEEGLRAAGTEEIVLLSSGRIVSQAEGVLIRRAALLIAAKQAPFDPTDEGYSKFDPDARLSSQGVHIYLLPNLTETARKFSGDPASVLHYEWVVAYAARWPDREHPGEFVRSLYLDRKESDRLARLNHDLRAQYASFIAASFEMIGADPSVLRERFPIQPVLDGLNRVRPGTQLIQAVQGIPSTALILPVPEQRQLVRWVKGGVYTPREVETAVVAAPEIGVSAVQLLKLAQQHNVAVPLELEARQLAVRHWENPAMVGFVVESAKKILSAERGSGPQADRAEREQLWRTTPLEIQGEIFKRTAELLEWWRVFQRDHEGVSEISFEQFLRLYYLVRDEEKLEKIIQAIVEAPLAEWERSKRWPYGTRLMLVLRRLQETQERGEPWDALLEQFGRLFYEGDSTYSAWLRDEEQQQWFRELSQEARREARPSKEVEESNSGLEEEILGTGEFLLPGQQSLVREAIELARQAQQVQVFTPDEAALFDSENWLAQNGIRLWKVQFFNEWIRAAAAQSRRSDIPDFVLGFPWRKEIYFDASGLAALRQVTPESRRDFVRFLTDVSNRPLTSTAKHFPPRLAEVLIHLHQVSGRALAGVAGFRLGMNIDPRRDTEATRRRSFLLENVWSSVGFRPEIVHELQGLRRRRRLPPVFRIEAGMRLLVAELERYFGFAPALTVDLGAGCQMPLLFAPDRLTVDVTLLTLPASELRALLRYSLDHMNRSNAILLGTPYLRELAGYVEGARSLLASRKNHLSKLESAMQRMADLGWNTKPQSRYIKRISLAKQRGDFRDPGLPSASLGEGMEALYQEEDFRHRFREGLFSARGGQGGFLPERILSVVYKRSHRAPYGMLTRRDFLVPNVVDALELRRLRPDVSNGSALRLLNEHPRLLWEARTYGWERIALPLFCFLFQGVPDQILSVLDNRPEPLLKPAWFEPSARKKGEKAELGTNTIGLPYLVTTARALSSLLGPDQFYRLLSPLSWEGRSKFVQAMEFLNLEKDPEEDSERSSPPLVAFVNGLRDGSWKDGISYLRNENGSAPVERVFELAQKPRFQEPDTQAAGARLVKMLIRQWGLVLVLACRRGESGDLQAFLRSHQTDFAAAAAQGEEVLAASLRTRTSDPAAPRIHEAVLRLKASSGAPLTEPVLSETRARLEEGRPSLLSVHPTDPSERAALERACFFYLLSVRDVAAIRRMMQEIGRQVVSSPTSIGEYTAWYLPPLLESFGSLPGDPSPEEIGTVGTLIRYLLYDVAAQAPDRMRTRWFEDIIRALRAAPDARRRRIIEGIAAGPSEYVRLLRLASGSPLKIFILENTDPASVMERLNSLAIDDLRDILRGIPPALFSSIVQHVEWMRPEDVLYREVYEQMIALLPDQIENQIEGGKLPNHYRALGIPRAANFDQLAVMARLSLRKLAWAYHPDRFTGDPDSLAQARRMMDTINEAKEVLMDRAKWHNYECDSRGQNKLPKVYDYYPAKPWYQNARVVQFEKRFERGASQAGAEEKIAKVVAMAQKAAVDATSGVVIDVAELERVPELIPVIRQFRRFADRLVLLGKSDTAQGLADHLKGQGCLVQYVPERSPDAMTAALDQIGGRELGGVSFFGPDEAADPVRVAAKVLRLNFERPAVSIEMVLRGFGVDPKFAEEVAVDIEEALGLGRGA